MQETRNTGVIRDAYASFLRGDIKGVLDLCEPDVVWKPVTGAGPQVPTAGERHGVAAVAEFFERDLQHITFSRFEPQHYVAQGDRVVALGHYSATTSAGHTFDSDFAMVFTLRDGRIASFQEFTDSAALNAAFTPAAMPF